MDDWPLLEALQAQSTAQQQLEYVGARIGEHKVRYTTVPADKHGQLAWRRDLRGPDFTFHTGGEVPFSRFQAAALDILAGRSQDTVYLQSHAVRSFPALASGMRVLPVLDGIVALRSGLWIGSGGQVVNLHYDPFQNVICMLTGRKRITMLPLDAVADLYPSPLDRGLGGAPSSFVRLLAPDLERFPRFPQALRDAQVAEVGPGEALCIPPFWWHHVESIGLNMMVNTWGLNLPIDALLHAERNLVTAMKLFRALPAPAREEARARYRQRAFGQDEDVPSSSSPASARIEAHLRDTIALRTRLPDVWRDGQRVLYEQYVFCSNGDPFPLLPGEYDKMIERMDSLKRRLLTHTMVRLYARFSRQRPRALRANAELS
jgi:hypothetical protein